MLCTSGTIAQHCAISTDTNVTVEQKLDGRQKLLEKLHLEMLKSLSLAPTKGERYIKSGNGFCRNF